MSDSETAPARFTLDEAESIREAIRAGSTNGEILQRFNVSTPTIAAYRANITRKDLLPTEQNLLSAEKAKDDDPVRIRLSLERDMQVWLRRRITQLEQGLMIIDDGSEKTVPSGRIDITAKDMNGSIVAIELKAGRGEHTDLGQILSYMGDLMETNKNVRGILVAQDFTARALSAARATPSLQLRTYSINFTFDTPHG